MILTRSPYHLLHLRVIDNGVTVKSIKVMYPSTLTRFVKNNYGEIDRYEKISNSITEIMLKEEKGKNETENV